MPQRKKVMELGWNLDNSYARLPKIFFTSLNPTPVRLPKTVIFNESLAKSLGLNDQKLQNNDGAAVFAGNQIPKGALPLAQAYAGHQFGHFTMLGDGRAILLGEQITPLGERLDIQLKGSGRTPYSRGGDGRASLSPMLREYIISEAMYSLGISTTRSLAVVTTGEPIMRESILKGAILTRVAASHLRVGTFEYASKWGSLDDLKKLADYTIKRHFLNIEDEENRYLLLLKKVIQRQAELIAKWQLVGFIHGVMNTDNMTISGETIDYGPCAFMDTYDPETVFSSIDIQGRYAYGNQPDIGGWNLSRFAETLLPLIHVHKEEAIKLAQDAVLHFPKLYQDGFETGMGAKLGLFHKAPQDKTLIDDLLTMMQKHHADYTNTFRSLTLGKLEHNALFDSLAFTRWYEKWQARLARQEESKDASEQLMQSSNPAIIPRNHRVEEALKAVVNQGDDSVMQRLLTALSKPYAYSQKQREYATLPDPSAPPYRTFCGT